MCVSVLFVAKNTMLLSKHLLKVLFIFVKKSQKGKKRVWEKRQWWARSRNCRNLLSENRKNEFLLSPLPYFWLSVTLIQQKSHTGDRLSVCVRALLCTTACTGRPLNFWGLWEATLWPSHYDKCSISSLQLDLKSQFSSHSAGII